MHRGFWMMPGRLTEVITKPREWRGGTSRRPGRDGFSLLSEVPEAIRYLRDGHARGKVVITL
jgi:hypothetical protein